MRSAVYDVLPLSLRKALTKFGRDLSIARRKRNVTTAMMAERVSVSKSTYQRVEKGDPSVALGVYAMALFVLGLGDLFASVADPGKDAHGLLLDEERLPQRVRLRKDRS